MAESAGKQHDQGMGLPEQLVEEVMQFRQTLSAESDRACGLMAGSYLDDQLQRLFRARFVDDDDLMKELFQHLGPLGAFSARIELAYAMGMLSAEARRDLHLIRKIRNQFGHTAQPVTFDDGAIAARCRELKHSARGAGAPPRAQFTSAVMGVCATIHFEMHTAVRFEVRKGLLLSDEQKRETRDLVNRFVHLIAQDMGIEDADLPDY